jgi:hypothetical protein
MNKAKIEQLFATHQGWLRSKDFNYQPPVYEVLHQMMDAGEVEMLKKGIYMHKEICSYSEIEQVSLLYSKGVLCLFSAWFYYELSTTVPYQYHLAFEHQAQPGLLEYPPVKAYFWSKQQHALGQIQIGNLLMYDIEKSVCDAVKFRNKVGEEMTYEVVKEYMRLAERNVDKLMSYARQMRIEKAISPILKSMA